MSSVVQTDDDKFHSSCPVRGKRFVEQRRVLVCCLVGPSLLLATFAAAGLLQRPAARSGVFVGRHREIKAAAPAQDRLSKPRGAAKPPPTSTAGSTTTSTSTTVARQELTHASSTIIPWQLVTTGKAASLSALPSTVRGNIENTLKLNPGMSMRYLSDDDCKVYIKKNFDDQLVDIYAKESAGHFRGDICRAAVLLREGGFYTDVDLEVKRPFLDMVGNTTSFMSVFTADGHILNALIATVPGSAVMNGTMREVRRWYKGTESDKTLEEHGEGEWMGTVTLRRGLEAFMQANCPTVKLEDVRTAQKIQCACGKFAMRFFQEDRLECPWPGMGEASEECPEVRMQSEFDGLKYGIFVPGTRTIVGWPRVATCTDWWCGGR